MTVQSGCDLHGARILVVEDTVLLADLIAEELEEEGCVVIGPAGRLADGLALAHAEQLDGALLDVNLAGEICLPIAERLAERGVPFAFLTGYGESMLPPAFRLRPRLTKPFNLTELARVLNGMLHPDG
jgi:DNA-binding response OmpR family regulator